MLPLCPVHAAARHLSRLRALGPGSSAPGRRLFPSATGGAVRKRDAVAALRLALGAAGIPTTTQVAPDKVVQVFGGHVARVSGAQFLAAAGVPVATIQLLGRWSSNAIERYIQKAPLLAAPSVPLALLGAQLPPATSAGQAGAPLPIADGARPPQPGHVEAAAGSSGGLPGLAVADGDPLPSVAFVPPTASARGAAQAAASGLVAPLVMHARTRKVHRAAADESAADQGLWAAPCGWRYGGTAFFRLSDRPPAADLCRRCFASAAADGVEEVDSDSSSSSQASTNSTSASSAA